MPNKTFAIAVADQVRAARRGALCAHTSLQPSLVGLEAAPANAASDVADSVCERRLLSLSRVDCLCVLQDGLYSFMTASSRVSFVVDNW